ncbi:MAG TPA: class I SAM-dependent methyltransferase [Candidatus Bathyarchaeia archaeon]
MSSNSWDYWYSRKEREVEPEIPKLAETLAEKGRLRVLDFGCGTGRHSIYFARKGFQVYGLTDTRKP